jgi:hydroxyquinol 1,2-dioxygenase
MNSVQRGAATRLSPDLGGDLLIDEVLARFDDAPSERFRQLMQHLARHLHAFAREVQLRQEEWAAAVDFLTRVGQTSSATRQEAILLSDILGLSMQVIAINQPSTDGSTPSTVLGPFYVPSSPKYRNGDNLANGAPGEPCFVSGSVRSTKGQPIPDAHLEVWQADSEGLYDVQRAALPHPQGRGQLDADEHGRFWFWTVKPESYPVPDDGPVGELLRAARCSPMRPAHMHFLVSARGYQTVTTHIFVAGDPYLSSDAVFGVKEPLIAPFVPHPPGQAPDGTLQTWPFYTVDYDFLLAPARASSSA